MSGVEVVATICNAIELARLGLDLLSICKELRNGGKPHEDAHFATVAFDESSRSLKERLIRKRQDHEYEQYADLLSSCHACEEASKELRQEIRKVIQPLETSTSWLTVVWCGILVKWKSKRIAQLQKTFETYRSVMNSNLSMDIW